MLRFSFIITLAVWCLGGIAQAQSNSPNATALSGAYEALLAYTAYIVDATINDNKSVTIDPDCASAYADQSICTLEQFIQDTAYANQALIGIHSLPYAADKLDQIAEQWLEAGVVGPWNAKAFGGGAIKNSGDIASLIVFLTKYLATNAAKAGQVFVQATTLASARIAFLRGWVNLNKAQKIFSDRYPGAVVKYAPRTLYPDGPSFDFFDLGASAAANPDLDMSSVISDINAANAAPDASINVVRAAQNGRLEVSSCEA